MYERVNHPVGYSHRLRLGVNTLFFLPGEVGGSETYLLETLRAFMQRSDPPELVLFTNAENEPLLGSMFPDAKLVSTRVRATNRPARIICEQFRLPGLVRRAGLDVLWSPGYTAPVRCMCAQVITILDMQYKRFPEDVSFTGRVAMDILYPLAAKRADAIVTISHFAKSEVVRYLGVSAEKVSVSLLGVDPSFANPVGPPLSAVQDCPYLLCVANTYPHKNVAMLVRAFNRVAGAIPHRLVLVGKPRLGENAVVAALRDSQPGRVIRYADLSRQELIALYQSSAAFLFPSLYEGFGLPVLEAMMAGVPVLTMRETAIPEVGGDGVLYVGGCDEYALAEGIQHILSLDDDVRSRLVDAARKQASRFTWKQSADGLFEAISRCL